MWASSGFSTSPRCSSQTTTSRKKTKENILAGSNASLLFITKEKKAFQIKGPITLEDSGPIFEEMKRINPGKHPGHSAAVLRVESVFSGAERLL